MRISIELDTNDSPETLKRYLDGFLGLFTNYSHDTAPAKTPAPKTPAKLETPAPAPAPATPATPAPAKEETAAAKKKREAKEAKEAAAAVAPAEPAKTEAPVIAPPAVGTAETGGVSLDMIRDKIIAFTKAAGPKAAVALVTEQTGAAKASAVETKDYEKLYKALSDALDAAAVAA